MHTPLRDTAVSIVALSSTKHECFFIKLIIVPVMVLLTVSDDTQQTRQFVSCPSLFLQIAVKVLFLKIKKQDCIHFF